MLFRPRINDTSTMWMKLVLTRSQNTTVFGFCQKHTKVCRYHIMLEILLILEVFFFVCQKITQMKKTGRGKQIVFIHLKIKILKGNWVSKYPVARKAYLGLWNRVFPQLSVERVTMTPFI